MVSILYLDYFTIMIKNSQIGIMFFISLIQLEQQYNTNNYYWGLSYKTLNSAFENVINSSGVYHLVTHPNILVWDQDYTWSHLDYISNKK